MVKVANAAAVFADAPPSAGARNVVAMVVAEAVEVVKTACGALRIAAMLANAPTTWSCSLA